MSCHIGRLWYAGPDAISNAVGYAKFFSRSHDAVIRVYDSAGNVIETDERTAAVDANGNKMAVPAPQGAQPQAMLRKVEEQAASIAALKSTVAQQQKGMEVLTAQLKEQAAQIQKVSAQLEVSKAATQMATNNQ